MKHLLFPCLVLLLAPIGALAAPFDFSYYLSLLNRYLSAGQSIQAIPVDVIDHGGMDAEQGRQPPYMRLLQAPGGLHPRLPRLRWDGPQPQVDRQAMTARNSDTSRPWRVIP